ncbi:outer membrane beta-barrel protein [Haliscomenobacter sp.]|uniref:outer membrane beta-barrel protein n=1 Tax=Haliscomenobacter sp. TaxID=2717303 RepID=UPI00359342C5
MSKPTKILSLSLFLLLSICQYMSAQTLLKGRVLDEQQKPLPYANVLLLKAQDSSLVKGAVTDDAGLFTIEAVAEGQYLISGSMIGYTPHFSQSIQIKAGQPDYQFEDIRMQTASVKLGEVTIKAQKPFIELQQDKMIINVDASPVAAGNNALELLAKSPGVMVDHNSTISLKGRSGVLVLINGKQTYMSAEEVTRLLENTPATSIEAIEIISNPSAKYDAAGTSGIINIRMKKEKGLGTNGNLTLGAGYGENPRGSAELRMNNRSKKVNVFGSYGNFYNKRFQNIDISRRIPFENTFTEMKQYDRKIMWSDNNRLNAGADWFLSNKTTLGVLANASIGEWVPQSSGRNLLSGALPGDFNEVRSENTGGDKWRDYTTNVNLKHAFDNKGHELSFDADYSTNSADKLQTNTNRFFTTAGQEVDLPNIVRTDAGLQVDILAFKMDYSRPLGEKSRLEAGWKSSFVDTDNDLLVETFTENVWQNDPLRSNRFMYTENIHAGYLNFNTQFKKVGIQMGLRGELTDALGQSPTLSERFTRNYFNLFPSLSISHPIGKDNSLSYNYSRRINRPSYDDLNPFVYFIDQYTFGKGNPYLTPEFTNTLGLNFSLKNKYVLSLNYNHTTDKITQVLEQDDALRQTYQTTANLSTFKNYSATISAPFELAKWWNSRLNVVGYINDLDSPLSNGAINQSQFTAQFMTMNTFNLPSKIKAEMTVFYQTKMLEGIFEIDPMWGMDIGASKPIWKGKGNLKLNLSDVFFTRQPHIIVKQGNVDVVVDPTNESRRLNATLTYKFGKTDVKPSRRRSTATEDELERVSRQ